jgi:hypothetical protein
MLQSAVGKKNLVAPSCQAFFRVPARNATCERDAARRGRYIDRHCAGLLGHSSSEITREVYLHSIPADARAAVEKVEELLNRPKLTQVAETGKTEAG